jgi:hypothetical protein
MNNVIDISKYNNNYMDRLLKRVEEAVENDRYVTPEDVAKAAAIYNHKLGIIERKAERLVNKELAELKKANAEADKVLDTVED